MDNEAAGDIGGCRRQLSEVAEQADAGAKFLLSGDGFLFLDADINAGDAAFIADINLVVMDPQGSVERGDEGVVGEEQLSAEAAYLHALVEGEALASIGTREGEEGGIGFRGEGGEALGRGGGAFFLGRGIRRGRCRVIGRRGLHLSCGIKCGIWRGMRRRYRGWGQEGGGGDRGEVLGRGRGDRRGKGRGVDINGGRARPLGSQGQGRSGRVFPEGFSATGALAGSGRAKEVTNWTDDA